MTKTFICVASGPSLTSDDCAMASDSGCPIIAVNSSWRAVPECQHIYAGDCCWWEENISRITSDAKRWCGEQFIARRFGINFQPPAITGSFNSGQRAIQLAAALGAKTILLLGYECSLRHGTHWHGKHELLANPDGISVSRWHEEFSRLAHGLAGVDIINCSQRTRLQCFPREKLKTALGRLSLVQAPQRETLNRRTTLPSSR